MSDRYSLLGWLREDLAIKAQWMYGGSGLPQVLKVLLTDGTMSMIVYRLQQWARRWHLAPIELLCNRYNGVVCGCIIGRGADFGRGFVLIHCHGIVINGMVKSGKYLFLEHQVTIGAERGQTPVLGDNVFIGAGAKIVGPVRIGDGAKVGANAVVVKDVPAYATVVGIPAKVVRQREAPPSLTGCLHLLEARPMPAEVESSA